MISGWRENAITRALLRQVNCEFDRRMRNPLKGIPPARRTATRRISVVKLDFSFNLQALLISVTVDWKSIAQR
jgi:hypothetical protein